MTSLTVASPEVEKPMRKVSTMSKGDLHATDDCLQLCEPNQIPCPDGYVSCSSHPHNIERKLC